MIKFKNKTLITSALPYVNNVPHLGTMVCIISADVYARFLRMKGVDVISVLGTDEHGTTTESIAMKMNLTPKEATDHFFKIHKEVYEWFLCSFDCFGRTTSKENIEITQDIFLKLYKNGFIVEKEEEQMYDVEAQKFLSDRFIEGECPHCSFNDARGDQCDNCGKLLNPTELVNPRSKLTGSKPVIRKTKHLYIKLNELQPKIEEFFSKRADKWSDNANMTTKAWLDEGLKERAITRDLKWGIPVPLEGYEDKVFYVWFDAPIGYIAITKEFREDWKDFWHNPTNVRLVQFMGKDNTPFHSILFPASLIGANDNYTLVDTLNVNEYMNYDGDKFSKSRGIGVFGDDAMATGIGPDEWRYYLMINRPEKTDTNFTWGDLQEKINNELAGNLGNLVNRALTFIERFNEGQIGQITEPLVYDEDVEQIIESYSQIELKKALKQVMLLSKKANQYFQEQAPWQTIKTDKSKALNSLAVLANMIKDLSILIYPVMPGVAEKMQEQLGMEKNFNLSELKVPLHNHTIGKSAVIFKKLEDDEVVKLKSKYGGVQEDKLNAGVANTTKKNNDNKYKKENSQLKKDISNKTVKDKFNDVKDVESNKSNDKSNNDVDDDKNKDKLDNSDIISKIDLRVAKIISVEKHPKADKLYIEHLDIAGVERTIVSGLVPHYAIDELVGKNIVLVYNLKPAELRGVLSVGMLLAAGQDGKVGVLHCPDMNSGDKITFKGIKSVPANEITVDDFFKTMIEAKEGKVFIDGHEFEGNILIDKNLEGKVK
ncbi:MAG: methionine--tRNA ligase [Candidatus Woesearchaeota archaeon]